MENIIEVQRLFKTYETGGQRVEALRGIDLNIERGQMVAIMGPSGCGKTTLLNTLSGIDDVTSGKVIIDGSSIHDMPDKQRTRYRAQSMGFVFQAFNLLPVLTGVENIELPLLLGGMNQKLARDQAMATLELVGLADQANKRPAEMSGGQQQRITVARAIVNDPAIIWADEPTGALDSETSKEIMDLLCDLNARKHQTFVLVTHDAGVGARAGRLVRMRDGLVESDELTTAAQG
ncbi:MAG: ABC transporter ATP-binding protein [Chloroflexi bacterium]|nr:ABC transporter ATP-binding protein [Chloroflexota bacterium]MDA1174728.1 ABC transporter ATP-binding protein [Chloroflexota bacterium]